MKKKQLVSCFFIITFFFIQGCLKDEYYDLSFYLQNECNDTIWFERSPDVSKWVDSERQPILPGERLMIANLIVNKSGATQINTEILLRQMDLGTVILPDSTMVEYNKNGVYSKSPYTDMVIVYCNESGNVTKEDYCYFIDSVDYMNHR